MSDNEILKIIKELKQLKVQETGLLNALEDAQNRQTTRHPRSATRSSSEPSPLPVQARVGNVFTKGDRVVITSKITKPYGRFLNKGDRTAVVTFVEEEKISIQTTNGTETWRKPKNLRHRREDE